MAWESVFRTERFSVGISAHGTDLVTEEAVGSSGWTVAEMPQVTYQAIQSSVPRSSQSSGSRRGPKPGRVVPRLALKLEWRNVPSTYDYTSSNIDTAIAAPVQLLLALTSASINVARQATCIEATGSDGNTLVIKSSAAKIGCLLAARDPSDGLVNMGFIESEAGDFDGAAPFTATLFEDLGAVVEDDAYRVPTANYCPGGEFATKGWTVRINGESVNQDRRYIGFVPDKLEFMVEDDVLKCVAEGPCYGGEDRTNAAGGLQSITSAIEFDAIRSSSRYVFASQVFTSLDDGTVDPYGSHDIRNLVWQFTIPHHPIENPAAIHGVSAVTLGSAELRCTFAVPDTPDYEQNDINVLVDAWERQVALSMSAYYGNAVGKLLAIQITAGKVESYPEIVVIDGVEYRQATLLADHRTGEVVEDGGGKPWRLGRG